MPSYAVQTPQRAYAAIVERAILHRAGQFIPQGTSRVFVLTTRDVWELHGSGLARSLGQNSFELLFFPGGEPRKRLAEVEALAENMACLGGDRSSIVVAFGGGILTDLAGFVAAIFMRGIPVIQIPTTLLAQVDAAVGGKTGANLVAGKNLIGCFHQPLAVLIDPAVLATLPEREYRSGLFEIVKHGIIADCELFRLMRREPDRVLRQDQGAVDQMIQDSVRIKAQVVSSDEKESGLRKILNFGHTFGHALEAETSYCRFLHGEAVGWGMLVATRLARRIGLLPDPDASEILRCIELYEPPDQITGLAVERLAARLKGDKKTIQGRVHFVLPDRIGHVLVTADVPETSVVDTIRDSLAS